MRLWIPLLLLFKCLPAGIAQDPVPPGNSSFATGSVPAAVPLIDTSLPGTIVGGNSVAPTATSPNFQGGVTINMQAGNALPATIQPPSQGLPLGPDGRIQPVLVEKSMTPLQRIYEDSLFHYTWIDFGENPGLRINRIEMTNAWADMRAANFFTRAVSDAAEHHYDIGLSFAVQWWKDQFGEQQVPSNFMLPPVLYDVYIDFGWRAALAPNWLVDLSISPGWSTDFRVTPPDGFRLRGHAITMLDMLPNLRGVLGIWYPNRNTTKILPVAGFSWQANESTRVEAIFPQPRIVQTLGCWHGKTWEFSVGGEWGGGAWAFKDLENERETIDYKDLRILAGIACNSAKGQALIQAGYVFSRQVQYGTTPGFDFDPGNAWMVRVCWDY
ncbi:MAG TPA: hypothetical protein PLN21_22150 [Gemmatales bacterium]|nr:hypothetical protein [Gemmatales bacterium]